MIFSSVPFLYYFFPVVILLTLAVSHRQQDGRRTAGRLINSILLLASQKLETHRRYPVAVQLL